MNLFNWLLVGHLVGDFLLQTSWMAGHKASRWTPLLVHCAVYTAAVGILALPAGGLSPAGIALVFISHVVIDRRTLVNFWAQKVTGAADTGWLKIMVDQTLHILVLALATLI